MTTPEHISRQRDAEALTWATRLDGGDLSPAELAVLDAWLASEPAHPWRLAHYQHFFAQRHGTLPALAAAGMLAADPEARPAPFRRRGASRRRWLMMAGGVAAAWVLGMFLWAGRVQEISTAAGQRQAIALPDGSLAELNARTRLSISPGRERRSVRLAEGEAFFKVTKAETQPFYVETDAGTIRVTGTWFNVRAVPGQPLEVTVLEGRVEVTPIAAGGRVLPAPKPLVAGEQLVFEAARARLEVSRPASIEDAVAWREGKIVFAGTPLVEAVERFARYHGRVCRVAPEVAKLTLGGRYTLEDFDLFLDSVAEALPVEVRRLPGHEVILTRRVGL